MWLTKCCFEIFFNIYHSFDQAVPEKCSPEPGRPNFRNKKPSLSFAGSGWHDTFLESSQRVKFEKAFKIQQFPC